MLVWGSPRLTQINFYYCAPPPPPSPQSKNLSYTSEYRQHQNLSGIALYYDVTYVHNIFYFREKNVRYKFGKKVAVCFQKFPVKFLETLL